MELIEKQALLDAYDTAHQGPPGGARKLIEEAPIIEAAPVVCCKDCAYRYDGVVCPIASLVEETTPRGDLRKRETDIYAPDNFFCANGSAVNKMRCNDDVQ